MSNDTSISDKMSRLVRDAEHLGYATIERLETKADETSIGVLTAVAIDIATLAVGYGVYWFGEGLVATAMGGLIAMIGILGLSGKVLARI